jgi:hypothetical protein
VAAVLSVTTVATAVVLASATLERWGSKYGEQWALESSLDLQPWRRSAAMELGLQRSLDARGNKEGALQAMRSLVSRTVADHPWDPDIRLWAAQMEHLARHDDLAVAWVEEQVAWFPADIHTLENVRDRGQVGISLPGILDPDVTG